MDWKIPAGIAIAVCLLFINFWWLTAEAKEARLDRDWARTMLDAHSKFQRTVTLQSSGLHLATTRDYDENWDNWTFDPKDLKDIFMSSFFTKFMEWPIR